MGYAGKLYGDYASVEDVIDTAQHIPSLGKSQMIVSLDAASVVSCSLTERSAEEETPITRAVSVPLCVCARSSLITGIDRDTTITPLQRQSKYQKEIRGIKVGRIATGQYGLEY